MEWDMHDHCWDSDYRGGYDPYDIRPLDFAKNKLRYLKQCGWKLVPRYARSFLTWLYYVEKMKYMIVSGVIVYFERAMDMKNEEGRRDELVSSSE